MREPITIIQGEDRTIIARITFARSCEPMSLENWSKITAQFRKSDRSILEKTSDLNSAISAYKSYESVVFTADTAGANGNNISLVFDGVDDIDTVVNAWNVANPTNTVSHNGTGTDVLSAGTINLASGRDAWRDVEVISEEAGKISIHLTDSDTQDFRRGNNQSFRVIIDKDTDRRIALFDGMINVSDASI